jgi:outer membrane receptor protein involved in Fe transport
LQLNQGQSKGSTVPTTAQRAGNFGNVTITDPTTGKPFPNNIIPTGRVDPIARAVIDQYEPAANQSGATNFLSTTPILNGNDAVTGRVDWRPGDPTQHRGTLFARYALNDERADSGNGRLVEPTHERVRAQNFALGHTYAGAGDWVNEFRLGYNRLKIQDLSVNAYQNDIVGQLGINGIDRDPVNFGLPTFILTSSQLITSDDPTLPIAQAGQTYQALDNWSVRRGRHTIQLGGEVRRFSMAYEQRMNSRGNFTFTGNYSGDPFGDFLLGFPQTTQRTVGQPQAYLRQSGYGFYAQDEFRVASNLIVTYGVRYEYNSPFSEKYNHMYNLDYSTLPKVPALVQEGTSSSTIPSNLVAADHKDFAPRLGIAWRPLPKRNLIFRTAYGLFYNPEIAREAYDLVLNGVRTETDTAQSTPVLTLKNPFVSSTSNGFPTYYGIDTHAATPYVQQWNAAWQYGVRGFLFEAAYIGTKGTHLGRFDKFNTPQHVETGEDLPPRAGDIQSLRTFPQLGPFIQRKNIANSSYNALQLRVDHRFAHGLEMQASYTWSKSIDDADSVIPGLFDSVGAQDERNLRAERGLSFSDVPRRFAANFAYDLPFGRGHHTLVSALAGGWTVSGTITLQDGTRENAFYFFADPANTDTPNRPNIVPGQSIELPKSQQTPGHFFNTAAFSMPAPYTFGNAGRDLLPTPGVEILNLAVNRKFAINERTALNFRTEFFNAFNHPNFGIPINNPDFGPAFGQIAVTGDPRLVQLSLRLAF